MRSAAVLLLLGAFATTPLAAQQLESQGGANWK